ncbi:MAG: DMT family transporter [Rhodospirillales bacterium]|nr:DMT family transporter [Rhodospirillales bacterium]
MSLRVWIWLVSLSVLWGGSFFFAKVTVAELGPLTVVFGRVALAAFALNLSLWLTGQSLFRRETPWAAFMIMGLLNNLIPFSLIFWGQTQIASGLASILNATTPLFTLVVAHLATRDEKMNAAKLAALLIGFVGVTVLVGPDLLIGDRLGSMGQLACLGAAFSYALAGVYGRRFQAMAVSPLQAASGQVTASTVLIFPIMLIVDQPWQLPGLPSATVWAALAGLALLSTTLAYLLYFRILAAAGATNLLLVTFLIPVTAILLGMLLLGEELAPRHFLGMALIGLGLASLDGRIAARLRGAK